MLKTKATYFYFLFDSMLVKRELDLIIIVIIVILPLFYN
jgi:hypothetical protein